MTSGILGLEKEKEPEGWKQLHVGGVAGVSGQPLQVLMTQLLQKHKDVWHGSGKRPTMYVANMDSDTALHVARPKHIAKIMGDDDVHGWITAQPHYVKWQALRVGQPSKNVASNFLCT